MGKIILYEEQGFSECMDVTGQQLNGATSVGSFSSQSSKPVNIVSLYAKFLCTFF